MFDSQVWNNVAIMNLFLDEYLESLMYMIGPIAQSGECPSPEQANLVRFLGQLGVFQRFHNWNKEFWELFVSILIKNV